jgi:hypothetical protein
MMQLRDGIGSGILKIKQELDDLGLDFREQEFHDYIRPFLTKIDELTPLKYGNNKRGNQRDEDY